MKLNFGSNSNAIQSKNKTPAPIEKSTPKDEKHENPPAKKATGLIIPGKNAQSGTGNISNAGDVQSSSNSQASHTVEPQSKSSPTALHQETLRQELENLPAGVDVDVYKDFIEAKNNLTQCLLDNKDMIGYALKRVMVDLKLHPELVEFLLPEDCGAMIRALRTSYGITLAIKEKKSRGKKKKDSGTLDISMDNLKDMLVDL